jgi:hypothetical protein
VQEDALVAVGDLEGICHFHRRPTLDVPQQDHLALRLRELPDRHLDHVERLPLDELVLRPAPRGSGPRSWTRRVRSEKAVGVDGGLVRLIAGAR